jgi:hypothetical protein
MIVTDQNVHDALAYMAIDPHPIALARKDAEDAETNVKTIYSRLFLSSQEGSDKRREADALQNSDYLEAKANENTAIMELERHKRRASAAEMLVSVWQSENANARAAERVR